MNQEAILPPLLADCGGSRRSTGSCCTNGCLLNSLSATRTQKMLPELSAPGGRKFFAFVERFFYEGLWLDFVLLIVHCCYPLLALYSSFSALVHTWPSPSSAFPCSLFLPLLLPVTALTAWLHVKAGAFCGSVTNLPGKTETICSGPALRGDKGVNT